MERDKITIFEKITLWWKFDGRYYHKDFIQGVKNLWKWFPTIWRDRDWDTTFIYEVIKVKLNNQAKYIDFHNRHTRAKRDAELMRLTSRLIQLCQDDHYDMEYMDYHESNLLWLDITDKDDIPEKYKDSKRLEIEEISENFDEYFKKYPRQYKRVMSGEVNRFNRPIEEKSKNIIAMEIAHENQDRCRKLLFKIMEQRIEGWWD
jgi:hypothetical protein